MVDLAQWFSMPSVSAGNKVANGAMYGRETHHLEGVTLDGVAAAEHQYHVATPYSLQFIKGAQGFPWDIKPYDSQFIYDRVTELDWTSPRDFKQFNPQVAMCPRFWDGTPWSAFRAAPNMVESYTNCIKGKPFDLGSIAFDLSGPAPVDYGGDVGNQVPTIILRYYWGGAALPLLNREELYLTQRAGWCRWTHANLNGTVYEIDKATLHNKIVAGGPPALQFPCLKIA